MGSGRQHSQIRKPRRRQKTRKDWTDSIRLSDNSLLMFGRRGACYFMLHSQGFGRGFAFEADLIKAVNSFEFTLLGDNNNGNS